MSSLAAAERAAICDLLEELGPDEPTLCAGWRTRDLAAHLVLRESRPDAAIGIMLPLARRWTTRVQDRLSNTDFKQLVRRVRNGPPPLSPFRPARLDELANGIEFFVHHEDVRRAQPSWRPRTLDQALDNYFWHRSCRMARIALRHEAQRKQCGIELVRSTTGEHQLVRRPHTGQPTIAITGAASELLMYVFGRRDHALVS